MLRAARAVLYAVVPAEAVLAVLFVSGVPLPHPVIVAAEAIVTAVLVLEGVVAARLYRAARRTGAGRLAALRAIVAGLVPAKVRRFMGFDTKGAVSLVLWLGRRRHGVPPGATAVSYSGAQTATMMLFLFAMVVELVGAEIVLRAFGAPAVVRNVVLVIDAYSILAVLAVVAACITRPHVITADEVRVRYGAFFDLRVPRRQIAAVRRVRNYNEERLITVKDDRLGIAVAAQTNLVLELTEPITAVRPLGRHAEVRTIRIYADTPAIALAALTPLPGPASRPEPASRA
ncbi:hypothetical protein ACGFNU_42505 [Spirillospora sp. NPDC048911]|uniref:hypothetical protein n=1 Tax=Spirillospora sp. NPDC048911 TaxID=3364527 RepID=UPI0037177FBC